MKLLGGESTLGFAKENYCLYWYIVDTSTKGDESNYIIQAFVHEIDSPLEERFRGGRRQVRLMLVEGEVY